MTSQRPRWPPPATLSYALAASRSATRPATRTSSVPAAASPSRLAIAWLSGSTLRVRTAIARSAVTGAAGATPTNDPPSRTAVSAEKQRLDGETSEVQRSYTGVLERERDLKDWAPRGVPLHGLPHEL